MSLYLDAARLSSRSRSLYGFGDGGANRRAEYAAGPKDSASNMARHHDREPLFASSLVNDVVR